MRTIKNHLLVVLIVVLAGCASRYHPVQPEQLSYATKAEKSDIELYYQYDVMAGANNVKQVNKELKGDVKVVAVKIRNNSGKQITIGSDSKFYGEGKELRLLDSEALQREMRQSPALYAGYLALFPLKVSFNIKDGAKTVDVFAGAIVGGTVAGINVYKAAKANKKMKTELEKYNVLNKTILPGETIYGLVGVKSSGYVPLTLKLVQQ